MTKKESAYILAILKAAYPSFYRDMPQDDIMAAVNLWAEMFMDESYALVAAAVKALIASKVEGYPPTIGAVKEKIALLQTPNELTESEAWALVSKAVANTDMMNPSRQFNKLPPEVQAAVGSPTMLKEWGMVDSETFQTVVASNFMRSYKVKQKRQKDMAALPSDVRKVIGGIAEKMRLTE